MANGSRSNGYEWVLSNALGGYALGSANLINHRKYHGLLIAGREKFARVHLVSSIEEKVDPDGGAPFFMDSSNYPNVVFPDGYTRLVKQVLRPFPAFLYSTTPSSADVLILKSIRMHPAANFTVVSYTNAGKKSVKLTLRPKFSLRDHHSVRSPGFWDSGDYHTEAGGSWGSVRAQQMEAHVFTSIGAVASDPIIYRNVLFPTEVARGYDAIEDLVAPFRIDVELKPAEEVFLVFGDREEKDVDTIICETVQRYAAYPLPADHPERAGLPVPQCGTKVGLTPEEKLAAAVSNVAGVFSYDDYQRILELAMRDFIAADDLIAGFPWFSPWGRDTLISMDALEYLDGGRDLAGRILSNYARHMRDGVIPNVLGEGGGGRNYDTVDASLWFALRTTQIWHSLDPRRRAELLEALKQVIANYLFNPSLPFHVDAEDGLVSLRPHSGRALTWMDAKIGGEPVTPRYGKPIEINALWYNVLRSFLAIADGAGVTEVAYGTRGFDIARLNALAQKVGGSLASFYQNGAFADRIEEGRPLMEIRPNFVIALSLPLDAFTPEQTAAGYRLAREKLLTPYGLRSLSPDHPAFRTKYMGNQRTRDLAYHQGTVWSWLLLPMAKTAAKVMSRDREALAKELESLIFRFRDGFLSGQMASVPELYDGDDPNLPKGAPAQCWSVAAIFVIEHMLKRLGRGQVFKF